MIDSLNWFLNILGAVLGIAGTLVLGAVILLLISFAKRLPLGIRRFISATTAMALVLTLFGGLAMQSMVFFFGRSYVYGAMSIKLADFSLVMGLFIIWACCNALFLLMSRTRFEGVSTPKLNEGNKNNKKQSSSSFILKVSSVLLQ